MNRDVAAALSAENMEASMRVQAAKATAKAEDVNRDFADKLVDYFRSTPLKS